MFRRPLNHWLVLATMAGAACALDTTGCGSSSGGTIPGNDDGGADVTVPPEDTGTGSDSEAADGGSGEDSAANDSGSGGDAGGDSAADSGQGDAGSDSAADGGPGSDAGPDSATDSGTGDAGPDSAASDSGSDAATDAAACAAPDGTMVVVDPVNGVDSATNGSGVAAGAVTAGSCAFKTITYALAHLKTATIVNVLTTGTVSVATNGETFPISVPANVTVQGSGGAAIISDVSNDATAGVAFTLSSAGSALSSLIIDGASGATNTAVHGIVATAGATSTLGDVEVRNFSAAGIRAEAGTLSITSGTNSHNNGLGGAADLSGLHILGSGHVTVTGGATPIQFSHNGQSGILISGNGTATLTLVGTPGTGTAGSVVANNNTVDGVEINQTGAIPQLIKITGLVAASNTKDGLRVFGGSNVQVRGSVFISNADNGVNVETANGAGARDNNVSNIDLGTDVTTHAGNNVFQSVSLPNNSAGVCLNIALNRTQALNAEGNTWIASGASVNCASTAALLTEGTGKACAGGVDIGGSGLNPTTITGSSNGVNAQSCTCTAVANSMCQ